MDGFQVETDGSDARRVLRAFTVLGVDARREVPDTLDRLNRVMALAVARAARASSRQSALLAPTVGITGNTVTVGGSRPMGSRRAPAYKLLYGAEFGSKRYRQFRARRATGYWFTPTVNAQRTRVAASWIRVVAALADDWGSAG